MTHFTKFKPGKRLTAVLSSAAVAMGMLTAPATAEIEQPPETDNPAITQITEGTVTWGIRESWRNYIGDGAELHEGVTLNDNKEYVWPIKSGTYNSETKALHLKLGGYIHNLAYCQPPDSTDNCSLDVMFKDLEVDITQDKQQVTGIFKGNTRENMAEKVEMPRQAWGNFDMDDATFSSENGETTISNAPGFLDSFPLYGKGGVADPLTIQYKGPGGLPEFGRELGEPGKYNLQFEKEGTVIPGFPKTGTSRWYSVQILPIKDTSKILVVSAGKSLEKGCLRPRIIHVVDTATNTVEQTHESLKRFTHLSGNFWAFDGEHNLYTLEREEGVECSETQPPLTLRKYSYENGQLSVSDNLWKITPGKFVSTGWDHIRNKLIVATGSSDDEAPGRLYLVDPSTATPGKSDAKEEILTISLPSGQLPEFPGASLDKQAPYSLISGPPAVLSDGSYIFPHGLPGARNTPLNAYSYKGTDGNWYEYPPVWFNPDDNFSKQYGMAIGTYLVGVHPKQSEGPGPKATGWKQILPSGKDSFFTVGSYGEPIANYYKLAKTTVQGLFESRTASPIWDNYIGETFEQSTRTGVYNEKAGYGVYYGYKVHALILFDKEGRQQTYMSNNIRFHNGIGEIAMRDNGEVIYGGINKDKDLTIYTGYAYRYGDFATQPTDQTVDLGDQESASVTFTAAVTEDTKDPKYQWQVKRKGESKFTDITDATEPTYTFDATAADADNTYRLLVETGAGWTASNEAALTVNWTPKATTPALTAKVNDGDTATFTATFTTPEGSTLGWKRYDKSTGLWQPIAADGSVFTIVTEGNTTTLTIKGVNTDMSGMKVQAYATSPAGVTATSDSALTVTQPQEIPDEGVDITGVRFLWDVGGEIQNQPPAGGSNYLSAGVSDGTKDTYKNTEGNVKILTGNPGDTMTQPTYDTRAGFLGNDSKQFVEITGGKGHINKDKSGTISWKGVFSVNFYGGLVPFTITNPKLTIDTDGTGTLVGDLSGYSSDMANPTEKTALDPQPNTVIARFTNASLQTDGSITLTPLYSGVKVNTEGAERKQNTEAQGWGSWPQEFVDFQIKTKLSSYFYTSSASEKPAKKAPLPVTVDFDKAETSAPGEGDTETDDTPTEGKDNDKQTTPAPNPGTGTTDNGTGTGTADNGKVTVIINNQQPDGSNTLGAMLQATTALGSIIALIVSLQTAWMIIASMPGGIPAQLAKLFPPAPWQQPAPAPAAAPAPVAAPDNTKTIPVAVPA